MQLRFINPNTTVSMTDKVLAAARSAAGARDVASAHLQISAATSQRGPAAIQGEADGQAALPGLLDEIDRALADRVDVVAIACFDDTGIAEARLRAGDIPVLGIGQAACLACLLRGQRFSVVTTLAVSIPVIEANLQRAGLVAGCNRVRASGVAVLELEEAAGDAEQRVASEIERALDEDGSDAIVLGCAGMADLAARFTSRFGVPVVDGVVAAVQLVPALARR